MVTLQSNAIVENQILCLVQKEEKYIVTTMNGIFSQFKVILIKQGLACLPDFIRGYSAVNILNTDKGVKI